MAREWDDVNMHHGGEAERVTPEMAIFREMNELNARISQLSQAVRESQATGRRFNRVISVTSTPVMVEFDAYGYAMWNDGPNSVFTGDAGPDIPTDSLRAALEPHETEHLNFSRRLHVVFWLRCRDGETASVRIRGLL